MPIQQDKSIRMSELRKRLAPASIRAVRGTRKLPKSQSVGASIFLRTLEGRRVLLRKSVLKPVGWRQNQSDRDVS